MPKAPEIPVCYDPVFQEDRRQARWDELADTLPVCTLCRRQLYPGAKFHTASFMVVCTGCVEELVENIDIVEEENL